MELRAALVVIPFFWLVSLGACSGEFRIVSTLQRFLYLGADPYALTRTRCEEFEPPDMEYPHTNLDPEVVRTVLNLTRGPGFWLELGSFLGNSAIVAAEQIKAMSLPTEVVCVDPFTGDANMWSWRYQRALGAEEAQGMDFLKTDVYGRLRIYEVFLQNVRSAGHRDIVFPVQATSMVGLRLVQRLVRDGVLPREPQVIYLDSAHESGETIVEARLAWATLSASRAVLFGDDFDWQPVGDDIQAFAKELHLFGWSRAHLRRFDTSRHRAWQPVPGLVVVGNHWLLWKGGALSKEARQPLWWEAPLPQRHQGRRHLGAPQDPYKGEKGNAICWSGHYRYDDCCHEEWGPSGNGQCWSGPFTYEVCCT